MTRSKDVNQMCVNCKNTSCDGTTSKAWTGCLFKDAVTFHITDIEVGLWEDGRIISQALKDIQEA